MDNIDQLKKMFGMNDEPKEEKRPQWFIDWEKRIKELQEQINKKINGN